MSRWIPFAVCAVLLLRPFAPIDVRSADTQPYQVQPITDELAHEYGLDRDFFKKGTLAQGILIATSARVSDYAHLESAYQFDMVMKSIDPEVAGRIRESNVLCILVAHDELTSDVPQFATDKTGRQLDFYNWRQRGFLTRVDGRPTVLFAEEDVLEYEGGMQLESILIHEFGHVIHGAGFDEALQERLTRTFRQARARGIWYDGRAAQRFRRVESTTPVSLFEALVKAFPEQPPALIKQCLESGDILVNGQAAAFGSEVTCDDQVLIVFGGPKECYAHKNRAEYWAEGVQCWYNTNRTMDHDHNHVHTREQLKKYDPALAALCRDVLGDSEWRFVSPRKRAGTAHLDGFDPAAAPQVEDLPHIETAALDYYDEYWKDYWQRLAKKHARSSQQRAKRAAPQQPPNIIVILADDLGYSDTSVYGGWVRTPQLERMSREGLTFTDFHSNSSVCSPTRAAFLTGRYQQRVGIVDVVARHLDTPGLAPTEWTIPRLLKQRGYRTALFGKWHLGRAPEYNPVHHGFDEFRGYLDGYIDYHAHQNTWWNGLEQEDQPGYSTHLITENSVRFIEENADHPFFLLVAHEAVHLPFQTPADTPENRKPVPKSQRWNRERIRPKYKVMLEEMDKGVGEILDAVVERNLADRTLVVFFSDNGAIGAGSNTPFRGGKFSHFEGGHRVPAIAWWPGTIEAGLRTNALAVGMDLLPTIVDLAEVTVPAEHEFDGISLRDLLLYNTPLPMRHVFFGYEPKLGTALRDGEWKLIAKGEDVKLFNLRRDLGETTNVAQHHPDRVQTMTRAIEQFQQRVSASSLSP